MDLLFRKAENSCDEFKLYNIEIQINNNLGPYIRWKNTKTYIKQLQKGF